MVESDLSRLRTGNRCVYSKENVQEKLDGTNVMRTIVPTERDLDRETKEDRGVSRNEGGNPLTKLSGMCTK